LYPAGVRPQKALRRFNSFREEKYRAILRIGIRGGEARRKGGDAYGSAVKAERGQADLPMARGELRRQWRLPQPLPGPTPERGTHVSNR
jgi:hypothetical protein